MNLPTVRVFRVCLLLAFLWAFAPNRTHAQPTPPTISKIEIVHTGPPAASEELIKANIRLKAGDPYLRSNADDDVRNLYATGYFHNIRVGEETLDKGVVLTFFLQGKPTLTEVRFEGSTKFSRDKLLKKVSSKTGEPLNERKLFTDAEEIKKLYQKSGYQRTEVKYTVSIDEKAGRGTATFEIKESPKIRVVDVEFVGAKAFPQKKLRKEIKTRRWWMFSWITGTGKLKDEEFEEDKERIADFYRGEGYIDFNLQEVKFDYLTPTRLVIRFVISEGVQYKIGSIDFKGNTIFASDELRKRLPFGVSKIFSPKAQARNFETVQDAYGAHGYIDARINVTKVANTERGTMDLIFNIEEKQQSFIEKIEIKGNNKTKDKVIRRELAVAPGEVFDMVRVKISTNRLAGLNYFEKADAQPEPTDVPNRKNLVIGVDEKSTGNFTVGAGFSSVDSLVGFVEVNQGNFDLFNPPYFTGGGQKFRLRVQLGTERKDYQLTFIEPFFLDRRLAFQDDLYYRELNFQSSYYTERRIGTRLGLTRDLFGDNQFIGGVSYTIEQVGILDPQPNTPNVILGEVGTKLVSKVGASISYDTRNSALLPDRGQRTELLAEIAGGPFGGDVNFYRLELKSGWYFKGFAPGHVFEMVGRIGVVQNFGSSTNVPLFDRNYLGGLYSLRGFDYRKVGPKDPIQQEPLGGDTYWFGSAEYSLPIIERLRFAVFYDVGMVYQNAYSFKSQSGSLLILNPNGFTQKDYKTGAYNDNFGFGIRLNLPIGPLRLDYGIPITRDSETGPGGKFQFGVGYTRDF